MFTFIRILVSSNSTIPENKHHTDKAVITSHSLLKFGLAIFSSFLVGTLLLCYQQKEQIKQTAPEFPITLLLVAPILLVSSMLLYSSLLALKKERFPTFRLRILLSFFLGFLFMVIQANSILSLISVESTSATYIAFDYILLLVSLHFVLFVAGLIYLGLLLTEAIRHTSYVDAFIFSINDPSVTRITLVSTLWYYIAFSWIGIIGGLYVVHIS